MFYIRKLLTKLNFKIIINVIIVRDTRPYILKYCDECKRYKASYKFDEKHEICNSCRNSDPYNKIDIILEILCRYSDITIQNFLNNPDTRKKEYVIIRHRGMFFAKEFTKLSLVNIGKKISDKDHASVLHAVKTVTNDMNTNKPYKKEMDFLRKTLLSNFKKHRK